MNRLYDFCIDRQKGLLSVFNVAVFYLINYQEKTYIKYFDDPSKM